jgi:hypothetical protein
MEFKDRYDIPAARVYMSGLATWNSTLKYGNEKTNPTELIFGVDEN